MSNISYERRKAVANAWKNEKTLVVDGKGTRDWSQKEQREIISKGRATGYQGHHMKSVDGHNSKAGDSNNIQFLTRSEHLAAHKGDFHNNTNGYYDPATGKMHDFGRNKAHIDSSKLSKPLGESQKKAALAKADVNKRAQAAKTKAKSTESRNVNKTKSSSSKPANTKVSTESKTLSKQRSSTPARTSNASTMSKTLSMQRSSSAAKGTSSGKSISSGHTSPSGKGTSGGRSSSSGKGSSHGH